MNKSIQNEFNNNSFLHNFTIGALIAAVAIDMMIGFPISHYSIFGQHATAFSSTYLVPPLDYAATSWFGLDPLTQTAAASSSTGTASTIMATDSAFEACVAGGGMTHFHGTELVCHP